MALIEFRDVRKAFGPKVVYRGLNLAIERGESLTVIGGSGQGKSVMLKMLVGLLSVDSGEISFDGQVISGLDERGFSKVRRRIGMLFQGAALFDSLTVAENVAFGLREIGERDEKAIRGRVTESLGYVGLEGSEDLWPADLSGGMKKRVGLARAIAVRPEVLLYDEPTTGLDPVNIARITDLIQHLQRTLDVTSIVVTHDMPSAFRVSNRIAMIQDGTVIFSGTPKALANADDPRVRDFVEGNAPENEDASVILGGTA
ncbi:MAG: ABC transporter ATP-binding protein [Myxococcota bacterium]|jgi:phospholipid/cholesterol/gamma-HCH transport system ATP-binding protein|nr:ABC transporter ATP-binding protein [Myxococcota bacterium]